MEKSKIFWKGVFANVAKALAFCIPLYVLTQIDLGEVSMDTLLPLNMTWVGLGVVLTGTITRYFWYGLGFSPIKIWAKALLLDWLGTFIFMLTTFGINSLGMFVYFLIFGFWIYPILIALGLWIGSVFQIQRNSFEATHEV
ncbi:hypothetical protein [Thermoflexibacter ruber]|uniref:Uncharacterized protein n=1 Tax=Thermoflexibacter ruber TaxID=1003 RepID=A0A1I2JXN7_9BACT|nr:hypothetical protein [Thermoflexibacter ruber]SFF58828.1 hypothetical protein SAMN04488541_10706 [Thermoflexibacter ruber]